MFEKFYQNIVLIIILSFLLSVAVPAILYFYNIDELPWQGIQWLKIWLLVIVCMIPLAYLIPYRVFQAFLVCISSYVLVRNYLWPISIGNLDGNEIITVSLIKDSSLYVSLILLAFIVVLYRHKPHLLKSGVYLFSLIAFCFTAYIYGIAGEEGTIEKKAASITAQQRLDRYTTFSTTKNIIVISFDSIQNDTLQELLEENDKLKQQLTGFIYYTDVLSNAPMTNFSILSTLTGRYLPSGEQGMSLKRLLQKSSPQSFTQAFSDPEYLVDLYGVNCRLAKGSSVCHSLKGIVGRKIMLGSSQNAYELALYRLLPITLSAGIKKMMMFAELKLLAEPVSVRDKSKYLEVVAKDKWAVNIGQSYLAFDELNRNLSLTTKPVIKFYHYVFTHLPVRFDQNCYYSINRKDNVSDFKGEILCAFNSLDTFMDKLKSLGIFDDSLIIITSDHGSEKRTLPTYKNGKKYNGRVVNKNGIWSASRYWPILLIKPPQSNSELSYIDTPASLVDIVATICGAISGHVCWQDGYDGNDLFANEETLNSREILFYIGGRRDKIEKVKSTKNYISKTVHGTYYQGVAEAMTPITVKP